MYLVMRMRKGNLAINGIEKHNKMFKVLQKANVEKAHEATKCKINHYNQHKEK